MIDQMLKDKQPISKIKFKVSRSFGFGDKIVDDRIKLLRQMKEAK